MRKWPKLCGAMVMAGGLAAAGASFADEIPFCQIADRVVTPRFAMSVDYASEGNSDRGGEGLGFVEEFGSVEYGYFRTDAGDFTLGSTFDFMFPTTGGEGIPDVLGRLTFDGRWDLRTRDGLTFRSEIFPGFYSDFVSPGLDHFSMPFAFSGIYAFHDQLSGQLGVRVQPGFHAAFDPILGIRWAPAENLVVDACYPRSMVRWDIVPEVSWLAGAEINRTWEYKLSDEDIGDRLLYSDKRLYTGMRFKLGEVWELGFRVGWLFGRTLEWRSSPFGEREVSGGYFAGISFGATW